MAQSPTHRFGQIIGDVVERSLRKPLSALARKHNLYLDFKHEREARQGNTNVGWRDHKGNVHNLDYVLEHGGSERKIGRPKAFIEIAYRRYTKHSRNKAQEMQGAILPLAETYASDHPFLGIVVAGVFTAGSLAQLRSHGFGVVYFPFASIVAAFRSVGIDAEFDEDTPDREVARKVAAWDKLDAGAADKVAVKLRSLHRADLSEFFTRLEVVLLRSVAQVFVVALHGASCTAMSIDDAIRFIQSHDESPQSLAFCRFEVNVRYTNGDEVRGSFSTKVEAVRFLEGLV